MPLDDVSNIGLETDSNAFCIHCVNEDKRVKSCKEIFEGGVAFFLSLDSSFSRPFAEKCVRRNMLNLSYWKDNGDACLFGEIATEEEFNQVLAKL
jgi:hypothetical protein